MRSVDEKKSIHGFNQMCQFYGFEAFKSGNTLSPSLLVDFRPVVSSTVSKDARYPALIADTDRYGGTDSQ